MTRKVKEQELRRIQKVTSKGQVTLPGTWRRRARTDHVLVRTEGQSVLISPVYPERAAEAGDYTVFDAIRDNAGKGLRAADLLKMLRRIKE